MPLVFLLLLTRGRFGWFCSDPSDPFDEFEWVWGMDGGQTGKD